MTAAVQNRQADGRREAILRAAEIVFADHSYEGASIRTIAAAAGVNPALIGYYFGAKNALYREIFAQRYRGITEDRLERLDAIAVVPGSRTSITEILQAWFAPFLHRLDSPDGRPFVRLLAREANDPRNDERDIVASFLNPSASRCIDRLAEALPGARRDDVVWGYQFCIAVMLSSVTGEARARALAGGTPASPSRGVLLEAMVDFAAAGLIAMAAPHGGGSEPGSGGGPDQAGDGAKSSSR